MLQVVICDDEQIALKKVKRELIRYRESRKVHFKAIPHRKVGAILPEVI